MNETLLSQRICMMSSSDSFTKLWNYDFFRETEFIYSFLCIVNLNKNIQFRGENRWISFNENNKQCQIIKVSKWLFQTLSLARLRGVETTEGIKIGRNRKKKNCICEFLSSEYSILLFFFQLVNAASRSTTDWAVSLHNKAQFIY